MFQRGYIYRNITCLVQSLPDSPKGTKGTGLGPRASGGPAGPPFCYGTVLKKGRKMGEKKLIAKRKKEAKKRKEREKKEWKRKKRKRENGERK